MKSWASSLMSPPKLDSNLVVRRSGIAFLHEAPPAWSNLLCRKPALKLTVRLSCSRRSGCRKRGHTVVARKVEADQLASPNLAGTIAQLSARLRCAECGVLNGWRPFTTPQTVPTGRRGPFRRERPQDPARSELRRADLLSVCVQADQDPWLPIRRLRLLTAQRPNTGRV